MTSFRGGRLGKLALPTGTVWLLTEIAEAKGRQELYARQAPQLLKALREAALVQSVGRLSWPGSGRSLAEKG